MTRTILTVAVLAFGASTLFGSAAEACISCEYVPEVAKSKSPAKKKTLQAKRKHKATPSLARQTPPVQKQRAGKTESVAKTAPAKTAAPADVAKADDEASDTPRLTGSSALIQQSVPTPKAVAVADEEDEKGACKKFFPQIGATLSVPCE